MAECAGWLHDLGKYREIWQEYLLGKRSGGPETRHAVFGAAGALGKRLPIALALAILGHHAGLHDFSDARGQLKDPALDPLTTAPGLLAMLEAEWKGDPTPALWGEPIPEFLKHSKVIQAEPSDELRIRMLFSCLVDADYLDTETYKTGRERQPLAFEAQTLFERLDAHVRQLSAKAGPTEVNRVRRQVYQACVRASAWPPGCFSLTAPTGSGKTLAALAFALKHAEEHGLRRVIVVLPFLAIIEQNARVYRRCLNDPDEPDVVLEHHSAVSGVDDVDADDTRAENESPARLWAKQATENWDAPVIVTTAVQFLESLFARRPGRCRKLHNIARSVVVFDEAQTLPFPLLDPILSVVRDLRSNFGVSFLFGSATQPRFARSNDLPSGFAPGECRELIEDPRRTFGILRRARLELPFLGGRKWSWDDLADRLEHEPRALVIVNLRKHAQDLFDRLRSRRIPGLFHLSSTMCPAHREHVLGKKEDPRPGSIYHALQELSPCILISTQVVEAGVDIDFPIVYRALSPLDAIIQACGRCDREGLLSGAAGAPGGRVIVFEPAAEPSVPPGYYSEATDRARAWLAAQSDPNQVLDDPGVFAAYHQALIASGLGRETGREIQKARKGLNFKQVAALFRLIDDAGQGIVVPFKPVETLLETIRGRGYVTFEDRRQLQRFTVNLLPKWVDRLQPSLRKVLKNEEGLLEFVGNYDQELGIRLGELPAECFGLFS